MDSSHDLGCIRLVSRGGSTYLVRKIDADESGLSHDQVRDATLSSLGGCSQHLDHLSR